MILNRDPVSSLQAATKQYVDKFAKIETLEYIGNGKNGANNPVELTFSIVPKVIFLPQSFYSEYSYIYIPLNSFILLSDLTTSYQELNMMSTSNYSKSAGYIYGDLLPMFFKKSNDGKTISFYSTISEKINLT